MTREQWAKLTPEEQRVKVAELCGFRDVHRLRACSAHDGWVGLPRNDTPGGPWVFGDNHVPDYLNDLNAMHEAESMLLRENPQRWEGYRNKLDRMCSAHWHATAAQRAEAFVLTLEGGAK